MQQRSEESEREENLPMQIVSKTRSGFRYDWELIKTQDSQYKEQERAIKRLKTDDIKNRKEQLKRLKTDDIRNRKEQW